MDRTRGSAYGMVWYRLTFDVRRLAFTFHFSLGPQAVVVDLAAAVVAVGAEIVV